MTNNFDNEEFDDSEIEYTPLNLDELKSKITSYSKEKLCEMIVCDRYFGCFKELAIICMEELARRRLDGDIFNFESYIENSYNQLPQLSFSTPDLGDVLKQLIAGKAK